MVSGSLAAFLAGLEMELVQYPVHHRATTTAMIVRKATPLNNAYADANSLPARVFSSLAGPMPVRIIDAL